MIDFFEFRELEKNVSQSSSAFNKQIETNCHLLGLEGTIKRIKASGACVNVYGKNDKKLIMSGCLDILRKNFPLENDKVSEFECEVETWQLILSEFNKKRSEHADEKKKFEEDLSGFLVALEIILEGIYSYASGMTREELELKYPFFPQLVNEHNEIQKYIGASSQLINVFNKIAESSSAPLKYLLWSFKDSISFSNIISLEKVISSRENINFAIEWAYIIFMYEIWKFDNFKIKQNGLIIEIPLLESKLYNYIKIAENRFSNLSFALWHKYSKNVRKSKLIYARTNKLAPSCFINEGELLTTNFLQHFFHSEDLKEKCNNVMLSEWLRAYSVLNNLSDEFLERNKENGDIQVNHWLFTFEKEYLVDLFQRRGISLLSSQIIIESFTFTSKSKDLLDCPLLLLNGKYYFLPIIAKTIDPSKSVFSILSSMKDISFKGINFEKEVMRQIKEKGLMCGSLNGKHNDEEYQCDCVLILNNEIYFIELKSFFQPTNARSYFEHIGELTNAALQLNRISEFFVQRMELVREKLSLAEDFSPIRCNNLILTTSFLGSPLEIKGCCFLDLSTFIRFLERKPLGINSGMNFVPKGNNDVYLGDITSAKFNDLIKRIPPIENLLDSYEDSNEEVIVGKLVLNVSILRKITSDYSISDP